MVGNPDAFKGTNGCHITNGESSNITNGNSSNHESNNSDTEDGPVELSYYVQKNNDAPLPTDVIVDDIEAYKSSLITYPIIHIIE